MYATIDITNATTDMISVNIVISIIFMYNIGREEAYRFFLLLVLCFCLAVSKFVIAVNRFVRVITIKSTFSILSM